MSEAKIGRPSGYSAEKAEDICAHLANGGLLIEWCRREGNPSVATVYRWMEAHKDFREAYARAREVGLHVMAEEVIAVSDDNSGDWRKDDKGNDIVDHEHVQRSRLRVDSRKWLTSKLLARQYGDKVQVGGAEDGAPVRVEYTWAKPGGDE